MGLERKTGATASTALAAACACSRAYCALAAASSSAALCALTITRALASLCRRFNSSSCSSVMRIFGTWCDRLSFFLPWEGREPLESDSLRRECLECFLYLRFLESDDPLECLRWRRWRSDELEEDRRLEFLSGLRGFECLCLLADLFSLYLLRERSRSSFDR